MFVFFFFFKQKTAYEMRISDWSSDVCSSDLQVQHQAGGVDPCQRIAWRRRGRQGRNRCNGNGGHECALPFRTNMRGTNRVPAGKTVVYPQANPRHPGVAAHDKICGDQKTTRAMPVASRPPERSEEHTSELQSLMRIPYAVFCLK